MSHKSTNFIFVAVTKQNCGPSVFFCGFVPTSCGPSNFLWLKWKFNNFFKIRNFVYKFSINSRPISLIVSLVILWFFVSSCMILFSYSPFIALVLIFSANTSKQFLFAVVQKPIEFFLLTFYCFKFSFLWIFLGYFWFILLLRVLMAFFVRCLWFFGGFLFLFYLLFGWWCPHSLIWCFLKKSPVNKTENNTSLTAL